VKGSVTAAAKTAFANHFTHFVPGHPIAGTERSGVDASFPELFAGRKVILTPTKTTNAEAVAKVHSMWEAAGATVVEMDVAEHDRILAATSHLPHMLAYTLVDLLAAGERSQELFAFAAGGFHDFTRIASSDPVMWRDICLGNGKEVADVLRRYVNALEQVIRWVEEGEGEALLECFSRAKRARDTLLPAASRDASPE
jgi:prephenate dehydrogenase